MGWASGAGGTAGLAGVWAAQRAGGRTVRRAARRAAVYFFGDKNSWAVVLDDMTLVPISTRTRVPNDAVLITIWRFLVHMLRGPTQFPKSLVLSLAVCVVCLIVCLVAL